MRVAVIGAGWAGLAAAVELTRAGHHATVFEASRAVGGRARAIQGTLPNGSRITLDNGQHILIGAYTESLRLMERVGVNTRTTLLNLPLTLQFPDGTGLKFPDWPAPLDALGGIVRARGWRWRDKLSLLRVASGWQLNRFQCAEHTSVEQLCHGLSPRVMSELIDPLCVSALNTPAERASAAVFLRVIKDALFSMQGGSRLLLPRVDLSSLFPAAAARWLEKNGSTVEMGARVTQLRCAGRQWQVNDQIFDAVILATSNTESARLIAEAAQHAPEPAAHRMQQWIEAARALQFEAITTVYAWAKGATLPAAMLTLRSHAATAPAQFVFDRGQLGGPAGLLTFVVSASSGERDALQARVLQQARQALGLALQPVQTVMEKRATFACTPGLRRPQQRITPGLLVCGDYVDGPYPATLEGAVRSGLAAAQAAALPGSMPMDSRS